MLLHNLRKAETGPVRLERPAAFMYLGDPKFKHFAYHGGRGAAKSHSIAGHLIWEGYERYTKEQGFRYLCAREIQKSINASVKQLLEDKIRAARLGPVSDGGNGFYRMTERSIIGGNDDVEFLFAGMRTNPDSIKSMEGLDGAWVEEANTVSQRSIDLLIPTIRNDDAQMIWSWNRRKAEDPVDNMFLGGKPPPRSHVRQVLYDDNPWFPNVLREEMEWDLSRDPDKHDHIWLGGLLKRSEARVFKNWIVDDIDADIPDAVWETPRLGADWGFATDPTTLVECYIFGRTLYFRREKYKVRCEIDETPSLFAGNCTRFKEEHEYHWKNRHNHDGLASVRDGHRIVADSARPETISYMQNRGFNIIKARKGPGSVEDGVEFMKSYDIVVHPDCKHVIDELTHYSYKVDPLTDEVIPVLADKKNHMIDACRYALEGVRRHQGTPNLPSGKGRFAPGTVYGDG